MKLRFLLLLGLGLCLLTRDSNAQSADDIGLSELKPASSPAFNILGVLPNDIARPKSLQSLEASVSNAYKSNNGSFLLPNGYALEFTPYWLASHPSLTSTRFFSPSIGDNILFNSSISLGTSEKVNSTDSTLLDKKFGFGYRTMIFNGEAPSSVKILVAKIRSAQRVYVDVVSAIQFVMLDTTVTTVDALIAKMEVELNSRIPMTSKDELDARVWKCARQLIEPYLRSSGANTRATLVKTVSTDMFTDFEKFKDQDDLSALAKQLSESNKDNYGFFLELAAGLVLEFPTSTIQYSRIPKYGVWLTPTYRTEDRTLEASAIARYIQQTPYDSLGLFQVSGRNLDFGGKLVYQGSKFSVSGEVVYRSSNNTLNKGGVTSDSSSTDTKEVLELSYRLNDKVTLSYSFGKDFPPPLAQLGKNAGNLISLLSVTFGLGAPTLNEIK